MKADHPREFLKGFTGVVVCDGYSAYRKLDREIEAIVFAGYWIHARMYFTDVLKALPKKEYEAAKETIAYPFRYLEYILTVMKDHQEDTDYRFMENPPP